MAISMQVEVKDQSLITAINRVEGRASDLSPAFRKFAQYMRVQTSNTFDRLRHGGFFRGVRWRYFAPQYTRKTDGVTVPAWGGVSKLRGRGRVKGRLRPSGQRVRKGDSVMQDTGTMRSRAALVTKMSRYTAHLGPQGVSYAATQQAMRPFLFFIRRDATTLAVYLRDYLTGGE